MNVLQELKQQGYAPKTVLDVGAHVGTFTQAFLQIFPDCVPTLVEPNPFCRADLAKLGFESHFVAASDKTGHATLFLTKEWLQSTGSSLYRENTHFFRDEVVIERQVETHRLDDLFRGRKFDFVKIDTQGAELDVLRGGAEVLAHADYILLEVSLVEYNKGGAKAEAVFAQLRAMGFRCADVTEFHRLPGVADGNLLQMDFLFQRRARKPVPAADIDGVRAIAERLAREGHNDDAARLLAFLEQVAPSDTQASLPLVKSLAAQGRILDALDKLSEVKAGAKDFEPLVAPIQELMPAALAQFNAHAVAGEVAEARRYLSALIALIPQNKVLLERALDCDLVLGQAAQAQLTAQALLRIDPDHPMACSVVMHGGTAANAAVLTKFNPGTHPLIRLRDLHDAVSDILSQPLTSDSVREVEGLLAAGRAIVVNAPEGSVNATWEMHYRVMLDGIDAQAVEAPTPEAHDAPDTSFATSAGAKTNWLGLRAAAAKLGAKVVFFAAADRAYVDLYTRWYVKSILKHCDVPFLVVVHVIGGAGTLSDVAKSVGIRDKRLFFAGDTIDMAAVTSKSHDSPPKGMAEKPLAHLQSVRFLRLGQLVRNIALPVFVSDIDVLLQDGVADLLERAEGADVMLNRNDYSKHAGSQLTANLVLLHPTANAQIFLNFLRAYLETQLAKPNVTRWLDQLALLMAKHHLVRKGANPRIDYFDTMRDINNVMYRSFEDNPFRFLSLYHGFDMSSLEEETPQPAPRKTRARRAKR